MKKRRFLITAPNTDCGKTHITQQLIKELASRGLNVGIMKPIETGVDTVPNDGKVLLNTLKAVQPNTPLHLDEVVPLRFTLPAAPAVASPSIDYNRIFSALKHIEAHSDIVLIESAGGLMTPLDLKTRVIDLAKMLEAQVIFISTDKLGTISDTLVYQEALEHRNIPYYWAINCFQPLEDFNTITAPYFKALFGTYYTLPHQIGAFCDTFLD